MRERLLLCAMVMCAGSLMAADLPLLCTTFPLQQLTRLVVAGRPGVTVSCLLPPSQGCPHDYALSPHERARLASAPWVIINGLGLEEFLGAALTYRSDAVLDTSQAIPSAEVLYDRESPHGHDGHGSSSRHAANPHFFASPRQAARIVRWLGAALATKDPEGAAQYQHQAAAAALRLDSLADEAVAVVRTLPVKQIVTQHDAFDYYARDVGLQIVGTVQEHPGHDPAAAELATLIAHVRAQPVLAIFTEPQYAPRMAMTLSRDTGIPVATLDPVASGPEQAPVDYYEQVQRANIAALAALVTR